MAILEKGSKKLLNAWAFYDWANSVYTLTIASSIFPIFYSALFIKSTSQIKTVWAFGFEFKSTALITFVTAFTFLVVAFTSPIISGVADYVGNKKSFLKMRYLNVNTSLSNLEEVKKRFKRFNKEDKTRLDSISIQFNSFYLKDSIWIKSEQAISKIKPLQLGFNKVLLKKPNFIQLKDSLGLYLMQINEVLERGNQAPLNYVLPTLKQIIINNRKLKLIKQLKSDIVNDAIKNKKFEIYN